MEISARGLSGQELADLESLSILLEDHGVVDIDVEPIGHRKGYTIKCRDARGKLLYSSDARGVRECVEAIARAVVKRDS